MYDRAYYGVVLGDTVIDITMETRGPEHVADLTSALEAAGYPLRARTIDSLDCATKIPGSEDPGYSTAATARPVFCGRLFRGGGFYFTFSENACTLN